MQGAELNKMLTDERTYVLSIAGYDPCAGAGLLSDVKTFSASGVYGLGVCTGITFQNDIVFRGVNWTNLGDIFSQLELLLDRYPIQYVKIGLIENLEVLDQILNYLHDRNSEIKIIWDPIITSSTGFGIHKDINIDFVKFICKKIVLIIPNANEIKILTKQENIIQAAKDLSQYCHVLLKGGHLESDVSKDTLYMNEEVFNFENKRIANGEKHGSGCVLSSAVTAFLALGNSLPESCRMGKKYINQFLSSSTNLLGNHSGIVWDEMLAKEK